MLAGLCQHVRLARDSCPYPTPPSYTYNPLQAFTIYLLTSWFSCNPVAQCNTTQTPTCDPPDGGHGVAGQGHPGEQVQVALLGGGVGGAWVVIQPRHERLGVELSVRGGVAPMPPVW